MKNIALNLDSIQSAGLSGFKGGSNLGELINNSNVLNYVFGAAAIALLIYLIMGGFQMMTSQGDPKALQAAQGKITSAIIGFIIISLSFAIVSLIGQILGVGAISNVFN